MQYLFIRPLTQSSVRITVMQQFNIKSAVIFLKDDTVGKTYRPQCKQEIGEPHPLSTYMKL